MRKREKEATEAASVEQRTEHVKEKEPKIKSKGIFSYLFDKLTDFVYNSLSNGFFGRIFTSYSSEQAAFERGAFKGYFSELANSKDKLYKIRGKVSKAFEESLLIAKLGDMTRAILSTSLKLYGNFLLSFGLYSILIYFICGLLPSVETPEGSFLAVAIVTILVSFPLLLSRISLGRAAGYSRILRLLLMDSFGFKEEHFDIPVKRSRGRANLAILFGMIAGLSTFFIHPIVIPILILLLVFVSMVIATPEIGVVCTLFMIPFFSVVEIPSLLLAIFVLFTAFGYLIKILRGKRIFKLEIIDLFIIIFGLMIFMGGVITAGRLPSFFEALLSCALILGYFLVVNTMRTERWINRCVGALAGASVIVAAIGVAQYVLGLAEYAWLDASLFPNIQGRVVSVFDNPNVLAAYLVLTLPLILAKHSSAETSKGRLLGFISVVMVLTCIILTWSRGAWLAAIISILIFAIVKSRKSLKALFVVGLTLPAFPFILPANVLDRFLSIGSVGDTSILYRIYTWRGSLSAIKDYFLCGIGYGNAAYSEIYPQYAYAGIEAAEHTHNLFLQILLGLGVFGLLIFLTVIFLFAQKNLEFFNKTPSNKIKLMALSAFSAVCGALVMGMFDYIWYNYRIFFTFWIVMGISCAYIRVGNREEERKRFIVEQREDNASIDI